jgi:hypothetical protein
MQQLPPGNRLRVDTTNILPQNQILPARPEQVAHALQVGWLFTRKAFSRGVSPALVQDKLVLNAALV